MLTVLANRTYPLAGQVGARFGQQMALFVLAALATFGVVAALLLWPARDPKVIEHEHPDLPENHQHKLEHANSKAGHAHDYLIDDLHTNWPR